ncbi:MAG: class I SAM-dependent methyltransferase [Chloroflexi bacterium]|nr:class I SAM-dependent methyltransferase [Chloroflexota bacterium]
MSATISENERKHTAQNPLRRLAIKRYFDTVDHFMPPDVRTAINAGCGEGFDARRIRQSFPDLTLYGFDISLTAVQRAASICPTMLACVGDAARPPFAIESADMVISLEVLEHLLDPSSAIEAYKKLTRRYLLLGVPNEPFFRLLRMANGMNIRDFGDHPEHVQHWNSFTFKRLLQGHDLRILKAAAPVPFIWTIVLCELTS